VSGDRYVFSRNIGIEGRLAGDLVGFTQALWIQGEIDGDLALIGNSLDLGGAVRDSVRFLGQTAIVRGTVEGDLLVFAQTFVLEEGARVTGDVLAFGQSTTIHGQVDGRLAFTGGVLTLAGTIGQDARVRADTIEITPRAHIGGDLYYAAREPLALENTGAVAGQIEFEQREEEEEQGWITLGSFLWWAWRVAAALFIGLVAVLAFGRTMDRLLEPIGRETLIGALLGFGAFLIVPAAAIVALVPLVTIPLSVIVLLLFTIALYLAKLPVALFVGRRLLARLGAANPSRLLSMCLGLPLLYLVFAIPYLGSFIWLIVAWLGLGAMILLARDRLQASPA
jgi:cytoskeletal protein CcmA (bactofilin family)